MTSRHQALLAVVQCCLLLCNWRFDGLGVVSLEDLSCENQLNLQPLISVTRISKMAPGSHLQLWIWFAKIVTASCITTAHSLAPFLDKRTAVTDDRGSFAVAVIVAFEPHHNLQSLQCV